MDLVLQQIKHMNINWSHFMDSQAESFYLFAMLNKILGLLCCSLIFNNVPPDTLVLKNIIIIS